MSKGLRRRFSALLQLNGSTKEILNEGLSKHFQFPTLSVEDEERRCACLKQSIGDVSTYLRNDGLKYVDDITKLLTELLGIHSAMADFVDSDTMHVFAPVNFSAPMLPKIESACAWQLIPCKAEILVMEDIRKDGRFRHGPLVGRKILFYAGAPIVSSDDHILGSICMIDSVPRPFDGEACALMSNFADLITENMADFKPGTALFDTTQSGWQSLYTGPRLMSLTSNKLSRGSSLWQTYKILGNRNLPVDQTSFTLNITNRDPGAPEEVYSVFFWCANVASSKRKIPFINSRRIYDFGHLYFARFEKYQSASSSGSGTSQTTVFFSDKPPFADTYLQGPLGRGSFGRVYRGIHKGKDVAIKVSQNDTSGYKPLEALMTRWQHHENVVATFDSAVKQVLRAYEIWIVMELCEGGSLLRWIDKGYFRSSASFHEGGPDLPLILTAATQIAEGLAFLHANDIIHGDLNCNNVLMTKDFSCKISDFGLSRMYLGCDVVETEERHGTITHMPIELIRDNLISKALDIYSFGVILYELFTSRRAWAGMRPHTITTQKIIGNALSFPSSTPDEYKDLAMDCMNDDYHKRPPIQSVQHRLEAMSQNMDQGKVVAQDFRVYA